jgi:hypothetical protein|nr:MAG TPA: hypothetical protein [Caudoviricetes sp.]
MTLTDDFVSLIKESMDSEDNLEELISLDEDLSIPDNFYSGSYLEEEITNLFPDDSMSAEVLKIYETN